MYLLISFLPYCWHSDGGVDFRKLLIDRLARIDKRTALFFSALAFGFFTVTLTCFSMLTGLGFCRFYLYKDNRIGYTIGLHMIVNFIGIIAAPAGIKLKQL
jgi:membrane protease YdiL (CAAX protease family)